MPSVAVVVCTRNRADHLARLLRALDAQTITDREVVIVDDASTDTTAALLGEHDIRLPHRRGPSAARNAGWRATTAPLVAFTDDDCEPAPDWLERLLEAHAAHPQALLQGPTTPEDVARGPLARTQDVQRLGPYYQCSNVAYPRDVLEAVGGFDDGWDWGGEDTDLAWRAIAAGTPTHWVAEARVTHAVFDRTPAQFVHAAPRFEPAMRLLKDHPALRPHVLWRGPFWKPSHAYVLLALLGLGLATRHRLAALLIAPYLRDLRPRLHGYPELAPVFLAYDLIETASTIRGGVRNRTPVA